MTSPRRLQAGHDRKATKLAAVFFTVIFLVGTAADADVGGARMNIVARQGTHGDTGRLVFDFSGFEATHTHRTGDMLTVQFTPPQQMASAPVRLPGIQGLQGGNGFVQLQLAKGTVVRVYHLGNRVVVDAKTAKWQITDRQNSPPACLTTPCPPKPETQTKTAKLPPVKLPAVSAPPLAMPAPLENAGPPAPAVIDFAAQPGAAAFRRGNEAILVFDTAEIPDISTLQSNPAFASAVLVSLQDAQIITLPLPVAESLAVTPVSGGWQAVATLSTPPGLSSAQIQTSKIELPMPSASKTVTISDPLTGSDLLIGTVTKGEAGDNFTESGPGFSVLPSWLGVAIIPEADNLGLNKTPAGFELGSAAQAGLPLGKLPALSAASGNPLTFGQGLNLPNGDTAALRNRMLSDLHAVATFPPLGRLNAQIALAGDMIALGLGPEAKGVLDTAVLENPAAQDNGHIAGMQAVAAVLSRRYDPADFKAPGIIPSNELSFWQAVGQMQQSKITQAAPALAADLAFFEAYPAALRNGIDTEIAETLVDAGQLPAAQQLVELNPADSAFDLARAKLLERQGHAAAALACYLRLAHGSDLRISSIAQARAVELQLAAGQLTPAQAADALDAALFDWRDAEHERHLRLRIAQLRAQAGQWPPAFTMLQSALTRFPDHQSEINAARSAMFVSMLSSNQFAQLPPIQAVAILQQNQDLIPEGDGSANIINLLAGRLDELDLPGAAAPMLSHLIQTIPPGVARASLGARLAQVDWDAGSPVAALADLAQTEADGLPPELAAQRTLLNAKAEAAAGNAVAAVSNLTPEGGAPSLSPVPAPAPAANPAALQTQAQIAEQSGQWPQAEQALGALASRSVPATGPINGDPENLLLRLATAASHNADTAMLSSLASQYGARVGQDPAGQMFRTLTTPTLTGDQGLNQALHEIAQLQALPAMVDAVTAPSKSETPGTSGAP